MTLSSEPSATARRAGRRAPDARITIGEMARSFNVSLRTLRFYEDRGLLVPRREGKTRYYAERDKERLGRILQLKQLGFILTEVHDVIREWDKHPAAEAPVLRPEQIAKQIAHLERQRQEIDEAITGLRDAQRVHAAP